jgi:protein dithiol oxidoreductase (disulfide-forming)
MRPLRRAVIGACLSLSLSPHALASPAAPRNGVDYVTLAQPQPVPAAGKKVEVIEFFMYHCPVCNALEPGFEAWIRQQGDRITVRRVHFPFTGPADPEAHLYLTLEALGKLDQMHAKVFKAVHVERVRLNTDAAIIDWVGKNGIDRAAFLTAWNSFGVTMKLRQLAKIVADYKIDSAPTLVIDGRFVTSPSIVNKDLKTSDRNALFNATLQVATQLVDQAAASK